MRRSLSETQQTVLKQLQQLVLDGNVSTEHELQPGSPPRVYALSITDGRLNLSAPISIARPGDLLKWPDVMQKLALAELAASAAQTTFVVQLREQGHPTEYMTVSL